MPGRKLDELTMRPSACALAALGRLDWAREECRSLEAATDIRDTKTVFDRLPTTAPTPITIAR